MREQRRSEIPTSSTSHLLDVDKAVCVSFIQIARTGPQRRVRAQASGRPPSNAQMRHGHAPHTVVIIRSWHTEVREVLPQPPRDSHRTPVTARPHTRSETPRATHTHSTPSVSVYFLCIVRRTYHIVVFLFFISSKPVCIIWRTALLHTLVASPRATHDTRTRCHDTRTCIYAVFARGRLAPAPRPAPPPHQHTAL